MNQTPICFGARKTELYLNKGYQCKLYYKQVCLKCGGKEEDAFQKPDDVRAKLGEVFPSRNWLLFIVRVPDVSPHGSWEFLSWVNGVMLWIPHYKMTWVQWNLIRVKNISGILNILIFVFWNWILFYFIISVHLNFVFCPCDVWLYHWLLWKFSVVCLSLHCGALNLWIFLY